MITKNDTRYSWTRDSRLAAMLAMCLAAATLVVAADEPRPTATLEERVRVTATRLGEPQLPLEHAVAHVTVIERAQIERSGAATVQELLTDVAGATVFDQVGNAVETTFDLRGFSGGTGVRVFVDGAPYNASRNNAVELELLPVEAIERIEVHRGSAAATAGGGAQAGVVRITTRRGGPLGGALRLAAGSDDAFRAGVELHGTLGRAAMSLAASHGDDDGFRENAGGDLDRLGASLDVDELWGGRLSFDLIAAGSELGNPGAIPRSEFEAGERDAAFNQLDESERTLRQLTVGFVRPLGNDGSLDVAGFVRGRDAEVLSTGRAAPSFGGFFLDSAAGEYGLTGQWSRGFGEGRRRLTLGGEWLDGATDALGWFTPSIDLGFVDRSAPSSSNSTARTTTALYVDHRWEVGAWRLHGGARWDDDELDYRDAFDSTANGRRTFAELSLRAGASVTLSEGRTLRAAWSEGFIPPSVEQLFAFPLFGSNTALRPEDSTSFELGFAGRSRHVSLDAALFRIDTEDEIVFEPDLDPPFIGFNVNAGEARREGLELALGAKLGQRLELASSATWLDAAFVGGDNDGRELPLAPELRLALALHASLGAGLRATVRGRHVGEQVLDNDDANGQPKLDAYTVVDLRLSWAARCATGEAPWVLFAELNNAFDESYATRGIYAYDFQTFAEDAFVTPAPDRRWRAGFTRRF